METGRHQTMSKALMLEIDGRVSHRARHGDARCGEPRALPLLRRWMVDFVDAQIHARIGPIGESIQASSEHDELPHSGCDRAPKGILRVARTCRYEKPEWTAAGIAASVLDDCVGV